MGVEADCIKTVETAIEKLGGLDIIIANAVRLSPFLSSSFPFAIHYPLTTSIGLHPLLNLLRPQRAHHRRLGQMFRRKRQATSPPHESRLSNLHRQPPRRRLHHDVQHRGSYPWREQYAVQRHQGRAVASYALLGEYAGSEG